MPRSINRRQTPQSPPNQRVQLVQPSGRQKSSRVQARDLRSASPQTRQGKHAQPPSVAREQHSHRRPNNQIEQFVGQSASQDGQVELEAFQRDDFDRDYLISNLVSLDEASNNIFASVEKINNSRTDRVEKNLYKQIVKLRADLSEYHNEQPLLSIQGVRNALEVGQSQAESAISRWAGLLAVLIKTNLACFVAEISLASSCQSARITKLLTHLSSVDCFPHPFIHAYNTELEDSVGYLGYGDQVTADHTLALGLDVLTQAFICASLRSPQDNVHFEPANLLSEIFTDSNEGPRDLLYGFDSDDDDHDAALASHIELRVSDIESAFQDRGDQPVDLDTLQQSYRWSDFTQRAVSWSLARRNELDQTIADLEGLQNVKDYLEKLVETHEELHVAQQIVDQPEDDIYDTPQPVDTSSMSVAGISRVQGSPRRLVPSEDHGSVNNLVLDDDMTDGQRVSMEDDPLPELVLPASMSSREVVARIHSIDAQANKENDRPQHRPLSLLDRQQGATRVEFDSPSPSSRRANKRVRAQSREQDTEENFVEDTRVIEKKRRVKRAVQPAVRSVHSETRDELREEIPTHGNRAARDRNTRRLPSRTGSQFSNEVVGSMAASVSAVEMLEELERVKQSDIILPPPRSQEYDIPKPRIGWTIKETAALMEGMERYGTSWAAIMREDEGLDEPRLSARDNVQCKDKARNLKFDFLKARQRLPAGFERVSLTTIHKTNLSKVGIPIP